MDDLAESDKVDWQFVSTEEEALDGVESGTYYAALIIQQDFTYNMYNMFVEDVDEPTMIFYQNQKKNPVATKISDTIISTVETNINTEFVKVMTENLFEDANDVYDDIEEEGGVDAFIDKLDNLNQELIEYEDIIDDIIVGNAVLADNLNEAGEDTAYLEGKTEESSQDLSGASGSLQQSQDTVNAYKVQVDLTLDLITSTLTDMENNLKAAKLSGDVDQMAKAADQALKDSDQLVTDLNALSNSLGAASGSTEVKTSIQEITKSVEEVQRVLQTMDVSEEYNSQYQEVVKQEKEMADTIDEAISDINSTRNKIDNKLVPQLNSCIDNMENVMENASDLMHSMSGVLASMGDVFGSLQTTISSADTSLEKTKDALTKISEKISKAVDKARSVTEDERVEAIVDTLTGDPELYGEFFSEPVEIESVAVYPIENYGSAVAPFYTTLSIWVGVIIMAAILKVKVDKKKYPEAGPVTLFFGRGMFFIVMGQVQTLITVLGDILLLQIQCVHPFFFWLTSAITSLVFSLLIYALVYTFGDVGKAAAVVVLVLQIAGSSGTYPIELLPEFFQKVYIFFPFPYAINAMRECICGMYEADFVIYLLELCIFLIPALVIGLLLRLPFEEINHYMEMRMEETEMM
jgi:putative membrane protein